MRYIALIKYRKQRQRGKKILAIAIKNVALDGIKASEFMIKPHSSYLRRINGILLRQSKHHRRDIYYISIYMWRFVAVFNRPIRRDASISKGLSSTSGLNAYGSRKPTTPKGQPAFRRVTKGYLPRGGREYVKRWGGGRPSFPRSLSPRR